MQLLTQDGRSGPPPKAQDHRRAEAVRCYGALQTAAAGAVYAGIAERCAAVLEFSCIEVQPLLGCRKGFRC